ncbi:MAG: glycosyltransferase [Actinomycetota bacterium]
MAPSRCRPQVIHLATRFLRGGSEARIRDITLALPSADHHLIVGADSDLDLARERVAPASLTLVRSLVRRPHPVLDLAAFLQLSRLLRAQPHDVLVTHQSKAGVLGRAAAARVRRAEVVHSLSMASFGPGYPQTYDRVFRWVEGRLGAHTGAYVVVGADLVRRYSELGIEPAKFHVVRSDAHVSISPVCDVTRVRREAGLPDDRPVILYLGSLEPRKNVLRLVDLLQLLTDTPLPVRPFLAVAGQGPLRGELEEALVARGFADDAAMLGFVDEPISMVAAADALVLLSGVEGLPQVLVQAAAVGTPFVAYDVDGVRELMDLGAVGHVVAPGALEDAAEALRTVLVTERRPSRANLSSWSPDEIARGYREVIEPLIDVPVALMRSGSDTANHRRNKRGSLRVAQDRARRHDNHARPLSRSRGSTAAR